MENWRVIVAGYPDNPQPKDYGKAIRTAELVLNEDLADFETEWLSQTLLFKPVSLFNTITTYRNEETWSKPVADSFKLITKIVEKHWDVVENYSDDIIKLCTLPLDVQARKEAILCLLSVVKQPTIELEDEAVLRQINALEEARNSKAPLALLVGTICRYHPEKVQEHFNRIWRIYLNMLQPNNKTDTVVSAVLQGMDGLFHSFGNDLEIAQLNTLYDRMSRECIKISKCLDVLLSILKHHANLFKEKLAGDRAIRLYIWQIETKDAMDALSSIYETILPIVKDRENIIRTEVLPRLNTSIVLIKHTAATIIMQSKMDTIKIPRLCSGIDLEFLMRVKKLSYEEAHTVSWCIQSNIGNSETMLLTAIMFYDNLPTTKKKDIVVNGILKANEEVRKAALTLLLKLSLQDHLDKYLDIWRTLLNNKDGPDLSKAVIIFEEVTLHLIEIIESFVKCEKPYSELRPIFALTSILLSLHITEYQTTEWLQHVTPSLVHIGKLVNVNTFYAFADMDQDTMMVREQFEEDTITGHILKTMSSPSLSEKLNTLHVIFTRETSELKLLSKALKIFETIFDKGDPQMISLLTEVEKLKSKPVTDSKDARVFQKDIAMFLGKYSPYLPKETFSHGLYVLNLKNKIYINIPNIIEGTIYKIDLLRICQICWKQADSETLYCILVILCANLCDRPDSCLQEVTIRIIHALLKSDLNSTVAELGIYPALLTCVNATCVKSVFQCIIEEPNKTVRTKLSECLQVLLSQPRSDDEELLEVIAEEIAFYMRLEDDSSYNSCQDVLKAFLASLKDNNNLIIKHIPSTLLNTISKTELNTEIFEITSKIYLEKIDLFTENQIKDLLTKIIENLTVNAKTNSCHCPKWRICEHVLNNEKYVKIASLMKNVTVVKKINDTFLVDVILDLIKEFSKKSAIFLKLLLILGYVVEIFELPDAIRNKIVEFEGGLILKQLLEIDMTVSLENKINKLSIQDLNAVVLYLKIFAKELLLKDCEKTIQCLGHIIENISPENFIVLRKNITACVSLYKSLNQREQLIPFYEKWTKKSRKANLYDICLELERNSLISEWNNDFSDTIHYAKTMSEILDYPTEIAKNWTSYIIQNVSRSELKWSHNFLSDLLTLSEKCLKMSEFSDVLSNNFDFVRKFVNVYFRRLILKPFVLKKEDCMILVDLLDYFSKNFRDELGQDVLDLVDFLWPQFQLQSTFDMKQSVLLHIFSIYKDVPLDSEPVKWAVSLLTTESTSLEDRSKIIAVLPAGERYSVYYKSFAAKLPVLLSEMQGAYVTTFRSLLDVLASNCDVTVFDIVCTLAGGDDTSGWWDYAIDACMKSLAEKQDMNIFNNAYEKTKSTVNLGICNRVMMPLLRHTSRKFCDTFITSIAKDLFNTLKVGFREPSNTDAYRKRVTSYAIVFNIMRVAFEKIPSSSLLCGNINACSGSNKPWYFTEQACIYCVTISGKVSCPNDGNEELKKACLWLQCSSYNCLATAIIRRKPNKKLYSRIFDVKTWENIVDKDAVYTFELRSYAKYKGSKPITRESTSILSSSFTGTVRSKLFLTTLTENPLQFDLIEQQEDEEEEEDELSPDLEEHPLNRYSIIDTITSILHHITELQYSECLDTLVKGLGSSDRNVQYLLAKAICNSEDCLKPYAKDLIPALLKLITDSPDTKNGKNVLHELHLEIISSILKWSIEDLPKNWELDIVIEYIVYTIIEYRYRPGLHRRLLNILNNILQLYGPMIHVKWSIFQDYCKELPKDLIPILPILERLLKNKSYLPDLLPLIFSTPDPKFWGVTPKLAEICGLALSVADGVEKQGYLSKFWSILNRVRNINANSYVKMLFYAQKSCAECCDLQQLKIITDLAPKIEKSKCLSIIASHLKNSCTFNEYYADMFQIISLLELFETDLKIEAMKIAQYGLKYMNNEFRRDILDAVALNCKNNLASVRKEAFAVFLRAFEDLVKSTEDSSSKRRALDSTPILNILNSNNDHDKMVMEKIFEGIFDDGEEVGNMVMKGVEESLTKDISMRFAELFYLLIYQSNITNNKTICLSVCASKFIQLLLSQLRALDAFKCSRLREDGLPQNLLTNEVLSKRTFTRTLLTSGVTFRRKSNKASQHRQMNVQMPVTEVIDVLLRAAKTNTQLCQELFLQIMKCLKGSTSISRRFDLEASIGVQLSHIMKRDCNSLTPLVMDASKVFVDGVHKIPGFKDSVEKLKTSLSNTEEYSYISILFEDLILRSGDRSQFVFSMIKEDTDSVMRDEEFTIEGLISIFGTLSNWDDLRIQEKKQLEASLPPLWLKEEDFITALREYFESYNKKLDYTLWFNKLVASLYSDEVTEDRMSWLLQIDRWPRSHFVVSAVIEAIQWHQSEGTITGEIDSKSCLAEWAARLMIRSAMSTQSLSTEDSDASQRCQSTEFELSYSKEANRRSLPNIVLQCVNRNQLRLTSNEEIFSWIHEKAQAYRTIGLRENNFDMLRRALEAAEKQVHLSSSNNVSQVEKLMMHKLILQLNNDLGTLSMTKLDDIMQQVTNEVPTYEENNILSSIYEKALIFYNDQWVENDEIIQNTIISKLIEIFNVTFTYNLQKELNLTLSIILDRLSNYDITMSDVTAHSLGEMINLVYDKLDFFSVDILKKILSVLPTSVLNEEILNKLKDNTMDTCKEYFQLICDPNYSLLVFCNELRKNVFEDTEWNNIFKRMKSQLFEITTAGSDYQALNTLKNRLYALEDTDSIDTKAKELKLIQDELKLKPQRSTLRLSQLSPYLCNSSTLEEKQSELQKLLRLPTHVYVVKFYEQVTVFTDSIRRPCVLKCLLSNGKTRRFVIKTGEPMLKDASLQRTVAVLEKMDAKLNVPSYNVIPLSDDSAIIEYLENHVRLRDLMEEKHDINNVPLMRAPNDKLILAPSLSLEQYNTLCDSVPPYVLRSSIEHNCSCIEEFIHKKRNFENTLSSMTIINWIFGVGDRHLQNIMFNTRTGSVCGVDYASCFQYGVHELPPARLTANLLAVCDVKVLESRLQSMMSFLRGNQKLMEAFVKTSFHWLGPEFKELKPLTNILKGATVCYEVTRAVLQDSNKKHKNEIIALLDAVFEEFELKDTYSVEEQISCLLLQCTEPRILSVTPQGWEPWL